MKVDRAHWRSPDGVQKPKETRSQPTMATTPIVAFDDYNIPIGDGAMGKDFAEIYRMQGTWYKDVNPLLSESVFCFDDNNRKIYSDDPELGVLYDSITRTLCLANKRLWGLDLYDFLEPLQLCTGSSFHENSPHCTISGSEDNHRKISFVLPLVKVDDTPPSPIICLHNGAHTISSHMGIITFFPSYMTYECYEEELKKMVLVYGHISGPPWR